MCCLLFFCILRRPQESKPLYSSAASIVYKRQVLGVPEFHLFTALAVHRRLFWSWIPFSGVLLYRGRLPKQDAEVIILRVGHLRGCAYELQQHRQLALRRGVDADTQAEVVAWPNAEGRHVRHRAPLTGGDELPPPPMRWEPTSSKEGGYMERSEQSR